MIAFTKVQQVDRSAAETFDVIGTNLFDNHPKWEREVLEVRRITPDPIGVGSQAVMVRRDFGRKRESIYNITEFEAGRRLVSHHPDDMMDFKIAFTVTPVDDRSCTVQIDVEAEPKGWFRILEPMLRRAMPKTGDRLARSMAEVVENAPART